ncbi:MAG: alpha/beta hydrolase [Acidobacteriaceae bacterium]
MATGLTGLACAAMHGLAAAPDSRTRFVITVSGLVDGPAAKGWGKLTAEFQKRGFPTTFVSVTDPLSSFTANEMRATQVVAALKDVKDPVVILGISNQGGFLPLVAAARPVRRLVYINATIPLPGKAFIEICNSESVAVPGSILDKLIKGAQPVTDEFLRLRANPQTTPAQWRTLRDHIHASLYARYMPNFYEVCPLKTMPTVENMGISGAADDQIRPEWEQSAARRVLGIEPVVIAGASHADIVTKEEYTAQLADACVKGL